MKFHVRKDNPPIIDENIARVLEDTSLRFSYTLTTLFPKGI